MSEGGPIRASDDERRLPRRRRLVVVAVLVALVGGASLGAELFQSDTWYVDTGPAFSATDTTVVGPYWPDPPPLPVAGLEQPYDRAGAYGAIVQAYTDAFTPTEQAVKDAAIVRSPGMRAAAEQVRARYPEAVATTTVEVGDVVFLSPTEALLHFELRYTGGALAGVRRGGAVLVDGRWKVPSETICEVLAFGGGRC